jgi:uncharacterized iron-regulated membrane protein
MNTQSYRKFNWRKSLRSLWLSVHLYMALVVGFIFVILGLTGSANVFFFELEELGLPDVSAENQVQPQSLDAIFKTVQTAHPDKTKSWTLSLPDNSSDYLWIAYPKPEEKVDEFYAPLRVLVDPYTGKIVSESFWGDTVWTFIYEIHADFLTGFISPDVGQLGFDIICFSGLFLLVSLLSGVYLWWPHSGNFKKAVTIKKDASPQRFYFDLHRMTGFYSAIILLILAFTGFTFSYDEYVKPLVQCFSAVKEGHLKDPDIKSIAVGNNHPISIAQAVGVANGVFPDSVLREIKTPDGKEGIYVVGMMQPGDANHKSPRSKVWIDQYSSKILATQDPNQFTAGETFLNLMWPLHSGEALGLTGRIIWFLMGFAPMVLYASGLVRWLHKRKAKQLKLEKAKDLAAKVSEKTV